MNLILYYRPGCPYCQKVLDYIKSTGISIPTKDIWEKDEIRQELIKIGGKQQVPCLTINGRAMYESSDIVTWLKENYKK